MTELRDSPLTTPDLRVPPTVAADHAAAVHAVSDSYSGSVTAPGTLSGPPSQLLTLLIDSNLRALLQALPTKADIEALIGRLEEQHRRDFTEVRRDAQALPSRLTTGEASLEGLQQRLTNLEMLQDIHTQTSVSMQLRLEEMEDRSRRNNLRIRGLPEVTGLEDLAVKAIAIFQQLTGEVIPVDLELDRIHRALGPRQSDPNRPRDVICRVHRFTQKEIIARKAWEVGAVEYEGASIKIMPDLSRAMLYRRGLLRPVLDIAHRQGATYRWGFPPLSYIQEREKIFHSPYTR